MTQEYGLPQAAKGQDYGDQGPQIQEGLAFPKNSLTEDVGRILDSLQIRRRFRFPGFSLSGIADGTDNACYGIRKEAEAEKVFQFIQGPFAMGEDQDAAVTALTWTNWTSGRVLTFSSINSANS